MDYLFTFSIICSGSGRSCWLLRGLYLSSSLYTFQKCISGLARGRHFSLPRIHPQLALKFLSRGDSVSVVPLCLPHFTNPARVRFSPCILSGLHRLVKCCVLDILTALKDGDSGTHIPVFLFHSRMRNFYVSSYISSADYPRLPSGSFYYFPDTWLSCPDVKYLTTCAPCQARFIPGIHAGAFASQTG